ncbi:GNAT family N-acetyltransferase [Paenibacillus sp. MMS18-CY102]|uniref:GNAT family N-acetyltransferase n=1 Tax=Paenibacillus sp. MMS18-CY102 TaxID=2682849 RepID=UPI00136569C5|nr:GNAT family N-acetyltransferase [Paenibacillus sp. MMS18-CY102]MWC29504.1 hypothetical protein [Paenibacillus sp. MMS18-CY102]
MYRQVEDQHDLTMFNNVWVSVWQEKGYELEYARHTLARYVVITPEGEYVGTSEVKPYEAGSSLIDEIAPFADHPAILANPGKVAELDKFALLKPFRGLRYSGELVSTAVHCAEQLGLRYFITLLEPVFARALRVSFRLPMEQIADKTYYKGDFVVPIVFDMEQVYKNAHRYDWLSLPTKAGNALAGK